MRVGAEISRVYHLHLIHAETAQATCRLSTQTPATTRDHCWYVYAWPDADLHAFTYKPTGLATLQLGGCLVSAVPELHHAQARDNDNQGDREENLDEPLAPGSPSVRCHSISMASVPSKPEASAG